MQDAGWNADIETTQLLSQNSNSDNDEVCNWAQHLKVRHGGVEMTQVLL
jgi:hypothetical protein